jgi:hypothetical protein
VVIRYSFLVVRYVLWFYETLGLTRLKLKHEAESKGWKRTKGAGSRTILIAQAPSAGFHSI